MELAGKVIAVLQPRSGVAKSSGNPWTIQEYVIETHEQFPHRMCFSIFGEDKISQANIQLNDEVNVSFDINSREYQGRWYTDIRAWKVEHITAEQAMAANAAVAPVADNAATAAAPATAPAAAPAASQPIPTFDPADSTDDLPF